MYEIIGALCTSLFVGACVIWSCFLCEWISRTEQDNKFKEKLRKEGFTNEIR